MPHHIIHIEWEGPYALERLSELSNEVHDYGVYQIYGGHPVYGSNVLLYIGKAVEQTFGVRIRQERWQLNRDAQGVQIYVGRLAGSLTPSDAEWSHEIDMAEKLLIFSHSPACNARNLAWIPDAELQDVHILNWRCHRDLLAEVSGARWTSKYDTVQNYGVYRVTTSAMSDAAALQSEPGAAGV